MPLPPARIVASKASAEKGSTPERGERAEQRRRDHAAVLGRQRFHVEGDDAAWRRNRWPRSTDGGSAMPSPGFSFSATAKERWVEVISVVRSGVTSPRRIGAAGLHQFGGDHHVDVARRRHQRQDRRAGRPLGGSISM